MRKIKMNFDSLTQGERFVVEWQYGMLGGFNRQLAILIGKADIINKDKLRLAFPDEVEGVSSFMNVDGWWQEVESKINK